MAAPRIIPKIKRIKTLLADATLGRTMGRHRDDLQEPPRSDCGTEGTRIAAALPQCRHDDAIRGSTHWPPEAETAGERKWLACGSRPQGRWFLLLFPSSPRLLVPAMSVTSRNASARLQLLQQQRSQPTPLPPPNGNLPAACRWSCRGI